MATFSVIPGAASSGELQALIVARGAQGEPSVSARAARGTATVASAAPGILARSPRLAAALAAARVSVRRVVVSIPDAPPEGTSVSLDVRVDGATQSLQLATLPRALPEEGLSFIVASCFDREFKLGARLRAAFQTPLRDHPAARFQLWIGDNVYMDVPGFSQDDRPYDQTLARYLDYLLGDAYVSARALHPNFTTYDDHEFWNDYPEEQAQLPRSKPPERAGYIDAAHDCLELFQACINPRRASANGLSFQLDVAPVSFFVADGRSRRDLATASSPRMLSEDDLRAFEAWASNLNGPGVLVLGQPLWIDPIDSLFLGIKADHNPPFFRAQYERIWSALRSAPFDMLILSGDIHYSRVMRFSLLGAEDRRVFELVTSPASEIPTTSSTVGHVLGFPLKQDQAACKAPSAVPSSQKLRAESLFATNCSNSFARVTLRRAGPDVELGVSLVDFSQAPDTFARAAPLAGVPKWGTKNYDVCHEAKVCRLRMR
jgi:hypothetical protein